MLEITDSEYRRIQKLFYKCSGVALNGSKKPLVIGRLRGRLEALRMSSFSQYASFLEGGAKQELEFFINALTTNETHFFRHNRQFEFLSKKVFPEILERKRVSREVRIWSAASSTGEEPYSLALAAREFFERRSGWKVTVVASDLNTEVLREAQEGVFAEPRLRDVPNVLRLKYFTLCTEGDRQGVKSYRLSQEILNNVRFLRHNLLMPFRERNFDIIFIRNVMIYFDRESKETVFNNILLSLAPGGYVFLGLSENLSTVRKNMRSVASGVYQQ